ncbi:MAG: GNAT family N-acetyltransferase [Bacteroidota bacterium]
MITLQPTEDYRLIASLNEEVQELHASLHPQIFKHYDEARVEAALKKMIVSVNCYAFVALQDGTPIGYMVLLVKEYPESAFTFARETLYIDQIGVLNGYQKTGVGSLMMEHAERLAKGLDINRVELDHWTANTVAAAYFRNRGYTLYREQLFKEIS